MKKIAYLAPEIPSLSATFVYNEILLLKKKGIDVSVFSVHRPFVLTEEKEALDLISEINFIYEKSFFRYLLSFLMNLICMPKNSMITICWLFSDTIKAGIFKRLSFGLIFRYLVANYLALKLKKSDIDHLHVHFAHVPTDIAMYAAKIAGITFSFTSHANDLFERGWLLNEKVARSKCAVTISEYNKRFLIDLGADQKKINVIHCGINAKVFSNKNFSTNIRTEKKIGTLGRFVEKKGFDDLLIALSKINEKWDYKLDIAGSGPLEGQLKDLVQSNERLLSKVEFSGALAHDKVMDWLSGLDFFILPCKRDKQGDVDGIPVVLMEAMAMGVPVISTNISGIPELIKDEDTGLLAEPANIYSLKTKIEYAFENPDLLFKYGKNGHNKVMSDFNNECSVSKLVKIWENRESE